MRSTANLIASFLTGQVLPPAFVSDVSTVLSSADDDVLFELTGLEPPAAASVTNVNTGYVPLRTGPLVVGDAGARQVTVYPFRAMRSSTSNATPRALLSGVFSVAETKAMPTAPTAGLWGFDLLYARVAYVDSSAPTKGTVVTLHWAPSPTYVSTALAPNFATLPAHTSSYWNVPLCYVRSLNGVALINQADIIPCEPPTASGFAGNLQPRITAKLSGIDARRAYSSANANPKNIVLGGSSAWVSEVENQIRPTWTPSSVLAHDVEMVVRFIPIPKFATTTGVDVATTVDDTRDWRNGSFWALWSITHSSGALRMFADEDPTSYSATVRQLPISYNNTTSFAPLYITAGQTYVDHEAPTPAAAGRYAGIITGDATKSQPVNGGANPFAAAGHYMALRANAATGVLEFVRNLTLDGGAVILLVGMMSKSR